MPKWESKEEQQLPVYQSPRSLRERQTLAIFPGDQAFRIVALRDGNGMTLDSGRWARLMDLSLASADPMH
jgi:hypothetical protein